MKLSPSASCIQRRIRRTAFTLIEMITVIAIILILMGLLFPAIQGVKESQRKTEAKHTGLQLSGAIRQFYVEYGKYPVAASAITSSTNDVILSDTTAHNNLLPVLLNIPTGWNATGPEQLNTRGVVFMEPKVVKDATRPSGGLYSINNANYRLHDPWGGIYRMVIDTSYDNQVTPEYTDVGALTTSVAVWCLGKDGKLGSGGTIFKSTDDVASW